MHKGPNLKNNLLNKLIYQDGFKLVKKGYYI